MLDFRKNSRIRQKVKITGGIPRYVGMIAEILESDEGGNLSTKNSGVIRVAFEHYWTRPDGMSSGEADDSTWLFQGEYEYV